MEKKDSQEEDLTFVFASTFVSPTVGKKVQVDVKRQEFNYKYLKNIQATF